MASKSTEEPDWELNHYEARHATVALEKEGVSVEPELLRDTLLVYTGNVVVKAVQLTKLLEELDHLRAASTHCWHCSGALMNETRAHCEECPAYNDCDMEGCPEPGCAEGANDGH